MCRLDTVRSSHDSIRLYLKQPDALFQLSIQRGGVTGLVAFKSCH